MHTWWVRSWNGLVTARQLRSLRECSMLLTAPGAAGMAIEPLVCVQLRSGVLPVLVQGAPLFLVSPALRLVLSVRRVCQNPGVKHVCLHSSCRPAGWEDVKRTGAVAATMGHEASAWPELCCGFLPGIYCCSQAFPVRRFHTGRNVPVDEGVVPSPAARRVSVLCDRSPGSQWCWCNHCL